MCHCGVALVFPMGVPAMHPSWQFLESAWVKPEKAGKGGNHWGGHHIPPPLPPLSGSVRSTNDGTRLWVLKHILPQQVVLVRAGLCQPVLPKGQVTERIQARSNAQRVW